MFLKNCRYVAAWDHELIDGRMLARTLLEEAVLLYKSESGKAKEQAELATQQAAAPVAVVKPHQIGFA